VTEASWAIRHSFDLDDDDDGRQIAAHREVTTQTVATHGRVKNAPPPGVPDDCVNTTQDVVAEAAFTDDEQRIAFAWALRFPRHQA